MVYFLQFCFWNSRLNGNSLKHKSNTHIALDATVAKLSTMTAPRLKDLDDLKSAYSISKKTPVLCLLLQRKFTLYYMNTYLHIRAHLGSRLIVDLATLHRFVCLSSFRFSTDFYFTWIYWDEEELNFKFEDLFFPSPSLNLQNSHYFN